MDGETIDGALGTDLLQNLKEMLEKSDQIILNPMQSTGGVAKSASVKTGSMDSEKTFGGAFFKHNDVPLPDGSYVNKEEIESAINNYIAEAKNSQKTRFTIQEKKELKQEIKALQEAFKNADRVILKDLDKIKNQDARLVSTKEKNIGGLFLGKNSIELKNGEYVNAEEISKALFSFVNSVSNKPTQQQTESRYTRLGEIKSKISKNLKTIAIGTAILATLTSFVAAQNFSQATNKKLSNH